MPRLQGRVRLLRCLVSLGRIEEVRPALLAAAGDPMWRLRMLAARVSAAAERAADRHAPESLEVW